MNDEFALDPCEQLQLQQLRQIDFWRHHISAEIDGSRRPHEEEGRQGETSPLPEQWELTKGLTLSHWQNLCIKKWIENDKRGIVKVVTGAGKTILALGVIERLQRSEIPTLRVAIVVPTIVLLEQWRDELFERSNLAHSAVGFIGAGRSDHFSENTRILICVLNSAAKKLTEEIDRAGVAQNLLLIVDECHRAGAAEMRSVFRAKRCCSLGLSATPERDDDETSERDFDSTSGALANEPDNPILQQQLGPIIFEMNYADAIREGILPPFRIVHYGLNLKSEESERYQKISREIKDLRDELETPKRRGLALVRWSRSKAAAENPKAARFVRLITQRKRLVYKAQERKAAVLSILRKTLEENPDSRAILFHESIEEVMSLFDLLRKSNHPAVAEHSLFPDQMRSQSLRLFRSGTARIIVSARSLIEGFNVPSADVGIIVAASSSVRQRVQTLGRLLRKNVRRDGLEKEATLYVLYINRTVDESIYEKANWETFVGADRNEYYLWPDVEATEPQLRPGPPRQPLATDDAIPESDLQPGTTYPGDSDEGLMYSLDTQGTIRNENGILLKPNPQLREILRAYHRPTGRFRITPKRRYVIKLEKTLEGWRSVYLGKLDQPVETVNVSGSDDTDSRSYDPGDLYPLDRATGTTFSVLQRDKRLIAKKTPSGIKFVIPSDQISDEIKRSALRALQERLTALTSRGTRINKIIVTQSGDVVYVLEGNAYYLGSAPEGCAGFIFD
jgi:superfamily II DNA or RNA helicase